MDHEKVRSALTDDNQRGILKNAAERNLTLLELATELQEAGWLHLLAMAHVRQIPVAAAMADTWDAPDGVPRFIGDHFTEPNLSDLDRQLTIAEAMAGVGGPPPGAEDTGTFYPADGNPPRKHIHPDGDLDGALTAAEQEAFGFGNQLRITPTIVTVTCDPITGETSVDTKASPMMTLGVLACAQAALLRHSRPFEALNEEMRPGGILSK